MPNFRLSFALCSALAVFAGAVSPAQTAPGAGWTGTWAASPMPADSGTNLRVLSGATLREVVHLSAGGPQVRIRFTNEFGTDTLIVADAHVAVSAGGSAIQPGTDHAITFGGESSFRIPPGAAIESDPVNLAVAPLSNLAISFYLPPQLLRSETYHNLAIQENYYLQGDFAGAQDLDHPSTCTSWYFLDGVDVPASSASRAIVAFGDSITDGARSTAGANHRWPNFLAERLNQDPNLKQVAVLDEGISGNRVINEGYGPSALSRFGRDVLAQNGVRYVIVLESINDIGHTAKPQSPFDEITAGQLKFGLKQLADAAHGHGLKIYGATLTPYHGAGYYSEKGEQIRDEINDWIRSSGTFDGVVDFDKITRDPQDPSRFNPAYDSGDHLHPSDAGYKAMAEGIDLSLFAK